MVVVKDPAPLSDTVVVGVVVDEKEGALLRVKYEVVEAEEVGEFDRDAVCVLLPLFPHGESESRADALGGSTVPLLTRLTPDDMVELAVKEGV